MSEHTIGGLLLAVDKAVVDIKAGHARSVSRFLDGQVAIVPRVEADQLAALNLLGRMVDELLICYDQQILPLCPLLKSSKILGL